MLMYMYLYFYLYTGNSQKSQNRNQDRVDFSHVSFYMNYNSFSKESEEHKHWILIILKNNPNIGQLSANMTNVFQNIIVHEFHTCQLYILKNIKYSGMASMALYNKCMSWKYCNIRAVFIHVFGQMYVYVLIRGKMHDF